MDVLAKLGVLVGATGLAIAARTRREDLRWRKAIAARDYLSDIHKNAHSVDAVEMIDCIRQRRLYTPSVACEGLGEVTESHVRAAFGAETRDELALLGLTDEQRSHIRERLDWLLYYLDRIAYLGSANMLDLRDFAAPLAPYAQFILANWDGCFDVHARLQNYKFLGDQLPEMATMG